MKLKRSHIVGGIVIVLFGWDVARPPEKQLSAKALLGVVDLYQGTVSKGLSRVGAQCRFAPTCSHYGEAVIRSHGTLKGTWLAARRVGRCGPWTPLGTYDPPPAPG